MEYGMDMTYEQMRSDEYASAIFERHLQGLMKQLDKRPEVRQTTLRELAADEKNDMTPGAVRLIERSLNKLNQDENAIKERIRGYLEINERDRAEKTVKEQTHHQEAIYPGQPWLDTKGERIHAHAGQILFEDGYYYWYGENKEHSDGASEIWTWGIRMYRSADLMNWEDMGLIIAPSLDDPKSDLFVEKRVDRPHILRCRRTGKYVCWLKLSGNEACFNVLTADRVTGPYTIVREHYRPSGHRIGDFDAFVEEETGEGYLFFDADHAVVIGMRLSEDYTMALEEVSRQYDGLYPPFVREGITLFERAGRKYMLTSGMTGYLPNQSDSAESMSWRQPFVSTGDPHVDDDTMASFNSQISQVFKIHGTNRYVAIADRWVTAYSMDHRSSDMMRRVIASNSDPAHYSATRQERIEFAEIPNMEIVNTSMSDYVWLPVEFDEEGHAKICWLDAWKP